MNDKSQFTTPHDDTAEEQILGSIIQDGTLIEKADLSPRDFYSTRNQTVLDVMKDMEQRSIPINIVTLFQEVREAGKDDITDGSSYLTYLHQVTPTTEAFDYHMGKIKEASHKRKLWERAQRIVQAIQEGADLETVKVLQNQLSLVELSRESRFKPISAKDLLDTPQVNSLWGEIFYSGCITQINSEPGVGKTTLLYNICSCGAMGKDFLGIPFSKPIKSVYFDLETPLWLRRPKLERIVGNRDLPENLFLHHTLDLKIDFTELLLLCRKEKYNLIIFDTQSRVLAMEDENDNSEANRMLNLMRRLTNETECALCLVHHGGKAEHSKGVYKGRGASAIAGGVDIVLNLEALDEEIIQLTVGKNRIIGTNPVLYLKKAGEDLFEPYTPRGEASGYEMFKAQTFILSLSPDREWQTGEIIKLGKEKGFNERTIERALGSIVLTGKVQRLKKGVYRIRQTDNSATHRDGGCGGMAKATDQWDKEAKELEDLLSTMEANHAPFGSYSQS